MNQMLTRLDQADANTRRFVSDASHELRSPPVHDPGRGRGVPRQPYCS
jgi:hypothetical protein